MAWFRGKRIETAENGVANARINQQAIAKEMDIMNRIIRRYHTPEQLLRRLHKNPEVQKDLNRIFGTKLGYEVVTSRIFRERGQDYVELETKNGYKTLRINDLENSVAKEIDLVAHTYAEFWYKKRMEEFYPLAYLPAHQSQVHSVN